MLSFLLLRIMPLSRCVEKRNEAPAFIAILASFLVEIEKTPRFLCPFLLIDLSKSLTPGIRKSIPIKVKPFSHRYSDASIRGLIESPVNKKRSFLSQSVQLFVYKSL